MYGDVAVLTGEMINVDPTTGDQVRLFVTQVTRRREQGWKFASFHAPRK